MCVTNTVQGRARPVLFLQAEIYRPPSCTALNEYTPLPCATVRSTSPSDKELTKVYSKRRRHGLPPGKTAKNHERLFVIHDYHDHSQDEDSYAMNNLGASSANNLFPLRLHAVLEEVAHDGLDQIVSWAPHGRCFTVHMPKEFVEQVLPK
jgi:HSF-type DNA-binding